MFTAIEVKKDSKVSAYDMCMDLLKEGVLCKPTHKTKIRFTPPLVMTSEHIQEIAQIFEKIIRKY